MDTACRQRLATGSRSSSRGCAAVAAVWLATCLTGLLAAGPAGAGPAPVRSEVGEASPGVAAARTVRIGEGGVLEAAVVAAALRQAIAARLAGEFEFEFELEARTLADQYLGAGELALSVELPPEAEQGGAAVAGVLLSRDGVLVRELRVPFRVRRWATVVVTTGRLHRGELMTEAGARLERRLLDGRSRPFASIDEVIGLRATRALPGGQLLTEDDLEPEPIVRRGEPVLVVLTHGAIEIALRAVALDDGWSGGRVRVRNPMTRRLMTGVVTDDGRLLLEQ